MIVGTCLHIVPMETAIPYILAAMGTGGIKASPELVDVLSGGSTFAFAPEQTAPQRLLRFDEGGLLPAGSRFRSDGLMIQAVPDLAEVTAKWLNNEMSNRSDYNIYIFEPLLEEFELSVDLSFAKIGELIYLKYKWNDLDEEGLQFAIKHSNLSWHFSAYFIPQAAKVKQALDLATNASLILIGAYDGESFLLWKR